MKRNPSRALAIAAGLVIVALTAAAFWLSYAHLAEVALAHGMQDKEVRAWAWPATLDLFIVAGELLMLRAALAGRVDVWAIGLTVVGSGSSIALNVAGVGTAAEPLDYVVAGIPPTAALLAFGALMRQIHQALAEHTEPVSAIADTAAEVTATVTVERVEDDQPKALPAPPNVVPAGVQLLPLVARPEPVEVTAEPVEDDRQDTVPPRAEVVTPANDTWSPDWTVPGDYWKGDPVLDPAPVQAAETPRQVVTEVVTLTPSELYRRASRLNRELVTSTNRQVTIERLREEYGLSRREAAELRRQVVTPTGGERS